MKLNIQVGPRLFSAVLEDNAAARAFAGMLREAPVVLQMREYSGFEKVGSLGRSLPASDRRTTAQPGDIVLYNGDQIVLLYGSNSWNYTRLGTVEGLSGWEEALGSGDVSVTFWAAD
ncbi:MAG: cyclophilin-like fold protein [Oscillospiraceae bacterium]